MGYLRYIRATERRAAVDTRAKDTFLESLAQGEPGPKRTEWSHEDAILREILFKAQATSPFTLTNLREQLKNKARWRSQKGMDLAGKLATAADKLLELSLLKEGSAPPEEKSTQSKWYSQAAWQDLRADGKDEVKRLELNRDNFA